MNKLLLIPGALVLSSCAQIDGGSNAPAIASANSTQISRCATADAAIDTNFATGNFADCQVFASNQFRITISPEDAPPINCSAWYAMRVTPKQTGPVNLKLDYTACGHRYWPKTSTDGVNWTYLPKQNVKIDEDSDRRSAVLKIELGDKPVFVAGQEIITPSTYEAWLKAQSASETVDRFRLGSSAEGRAIDAIRFGKSPDAIREQIVMVGRQHPPEVTGALAMLPFVEELLSDSELAKKYRARFETTIVPMLNPDGVVKGYWRHNTGGTDLNRDWGPFKQPETRLMQKLLQDIAADPAERLRFFADFHSTQRDVFYTIPDSLPSDPPHYLKIWLDRYQVRMGDDYKVNIQSEQES